MSSKHRCGSNRAREAKQGARTPTHVEEVLPRAALRTAARTGPGRGRGVLGVHVGGGFSCRVHRCAPFWGAVGVHGPCNEKTSLAAPDDNTVHAFTVKAPSVSQRRSFRLYLPPWVTSPLPTLSHTLCVQMGAARPCLGGLSPLQRSRAPTTKQRPRHFPYRTVNLRPLAARRTPRMGT